MLGALSGGVAERWVQAGELDSKVSTAGLTDRNAIPLPLARLDEQVNGAITCDSL